MRLTTKKIRAMTNSRWTDPPSVYEVPNPSAHIIMRIRKIAQSMSQFLSVENLPLCYAPSGTVYPERLITSGLFAIRLTLFTSDTSEPSRDIFLALST